MATAPKLKRAKQTRRATVRENVWHDINALWGSTVGGRQLAQLTTTATVAGQRIQKQLGINRNPISVDPLLRRLRVSAIAGTLAIGDLQIEVVPKFLQSSHVDWQRTLLTILARNRSSHLSYWRVAVSETPKSSFLDHIAKAYATALIDAQRHELVHAYTVREESRPYLRGRLAINRQMRGAITRPHMVECDVDSFDPDNHYNQLLIWAGDTLLQHVIDPRIREDLQGVTDSIAGHVSKRLLPSIIPQRLPQQFLHYGEAFETAKAMALGFFRGYGFGFAAGFGLVVGMDKIYERFIERSLQVALHPSRTVNDVEVRPQLTRLYAVRVTPETRSYYSRPDNVVLKSGLPVLLVDAKYKTLADADEGSTKRPGNADIYQLAAALVAHKCSRGLLIYPLVPGDLRFQNRRTLVWHVDDPRFVLAAAVVDISKVETKQDLERLDNDLQSIIMEVLAIPLPPAPGVSSAF
jgi:5-methylcytosine-specific restriction enzyme subunit McrC